MCVYHIFIHSSIKGHLDCFHVLAIVNSAAVNTGVGISFQIIVLYGYMPRCGIAESYCNSIFNFLRNLLAFLPSLAPTSLPTNSVGGFPFLHTLSCIQTTYFLCLYFIAHLPALEQELQEGRSVVCLVHCGNLSAGNNA